MKVIKALALVMVFLVLYSVTLSNRSLDDSEVVASLTQEIATYEHANAVLRAEIASQGSLTAAALEIQAKGFSAPDSIATLPAAASVASR